MTWEYLQAVWNFDKRSGRHRGGGLPNHRPQYRRATSTCERSSPNTATGWSLGSNVGKPGANGSQPKTPTEGPSLKTQTMAAVSPPTYNPFLHKEFLQAAGADAPIVNEIRKGVRTTGSDTPAGCLVNPPIGRVRGLQTLRQKGHQSLQTRPETAKRPEAKEKRSR